MLANLPTSLLSLSIDVSVLLSCLKPYFLWQFLSLVTFLKAYYEALFTMHLEVKHFVSVDKFSEELFEGPLLHGCF